MSPRQIRRRNSPLDCDGTGTMGRMAWAYHTIFRSMQLESSSESAIGEASAMGSRLNGEATSPAGKRKREASP